MQASRNQNGKRVLIVDDSAISRSLSRNIVESLGATAFVARNGRQALEACREHVFDLILMDCRMPGIDGFATTRLIRDLLSKKRRPPAVPVIGVTATFSPETKKRCLRAGMDDCLAKPLRRRALASLLGTSLAAA
jgi:CheY-like chemotaxis protein